jgi:hypothetical protein
MGISLDFGFWKNHRKNQNPLNYDKVQVFLLFGGGGISEFFQVGVLKVQNAKTKQEVKKKKKVS